MAMWSTVRAAALGAIISHLFIRGRGPFALAERPKMWRFGLVAPDDVKAEWPAAPAMRRYAPEAAKTPVGAAAPAVPPRAPVALGEPLWPHVASHRRDQDAVLGLALNYRLSDHLRFVGTLRKTGYAGDIVIATQREAKIPKEAARFLQAMRVLCYPIAPVCNTSVSSIKHKTCHWHPTQPPLPLAIIRHVLYRSWVEHYDDSSLFYVADYRDTFFQANVLFFSASGARDGASRRCFCQICFGRLQARGASPPHHHEQTRPPSSAPSLSSSPTPSTRCAPSARPRAPTPRPTSCSSPSTSRSRRSATARSTAAGCAAAGARASTRRSRSRLCSAAARTWARAARSRRSSRRCCTRRAQGSRRRGARGAVTLACTTRAPRDARPPPQDPPLCPALAVLARAPPSAARRTTTPARVPCRALLRACEEHSLASRVTTTRAAHVWIRRRRVFPLSSPRRAAVSATSGGVRDERRCHAGRGA